MDEQLTRDLEETERAYRDAQNAVEAAWKKLARETVEEGFDLKTFWRNEQDALAAENKKAEAYKAWMEVYQVAQFANDDDPAYFEH